MEAFYQCTSLRQVSLPSSLNSIAARAFYNCKLTSVVIPESVTNISSQAFSYQEGNTLRAAYFLGPQPAIADSAFRYDMNYPHPDFAIYYHISNAVSWADYTVYKTKAFCSLTLDLKDGNVPESSFVVVDSTGHITAPADPIRPDYTFGGWYKEADCINVFDFTVDTVTDDLTLYAKWTANAPLPAPVLTADNTNNTVGQAVDITFDTDANWEPIITGITVNGSALTSDQYTLTAGNINIATSVFTATGDYAIVVKATGYVDATVTQTIVAEPVSPNPVYTVAPVEDPVYTPGTQNGITAMTVNAGILGLKYFAVNVAPITTHEGTEAVVFTHTRNNAQMTINVTKADFDVVSIAQAGFNVLAGDVVKAYVVDDLTNSRTINPIILQ